MIASAHRRRRRPRHLRIRPPRRARRRVAGKRRGGETAIGRNAPLGALADDVGAGFGVARRAAGRLDEVVEPGALVLLVDRIGDETGDVFLVRADQRVEDRVALDFALEFRPRRQAGCVRQRRASRPSPSLRSPHRSSVPSHPPRAAFESRLRFSRGYASSARAPQCAKRGGAARRAIAADSPPRPDRARRRPSRAPNRGRSAALRTTAPRIRRARRDSRRPRRGRRRAAAPR